MNGDQPLDTPPSVGWTSSPLLRGVLIFSLFRAVYGTGILVVTYLLASGNTTPSWTPWVFLGVSMIVSRRLFSWMKQRWPSVFNPSMRDSGDVTPLHQ